MTVLMWNRLRSLFKASDTPWTYGRMTVVFGCSPTSTTSLGGPKYQWTNHLGYPFFSTALTTWSLSFPWASCIDESTSALCCSMHATAAFWAKGWWELKSRYLSLWVVVYKLLTKPFGAVWRWRKFVLIAFSQFRLSTGNNENRKSTNLKNRQQIAREMEGKYSYNIMMVLESDKHYMKSRNEYMVGFLNRHCIG